MSWPEAFALVGSIFGMALLFKWLSGPTVIYRERDEPLRNVRKHQPCSNPQPMWSYKKTTTTTTTTPKKKESQEPVA